jgi:regulator of sigma E protease
VLANFTPGQIVLAILGVGFLIAFHELGHYMAARLLGMRVLSYSLGLGPRLFGFRHQEIEYRLSWIPFGGFVAVAGASTFDEAARDDPKAYLNAPRWKRWLFLAAGPGFNYIAAVFFFFIFFAGWPSPTDAVTVELVRVHAGPAQQAGIQAGEYVAAVGGVAVDGDAFRKAIVESNGQPLTFTVLHQNDDDSLTSRDVVVVPAAVEGGFKLGVEPATRYPSAGVFATVAAAGYTAFAESVALLGALKALVAREPGVEVGGPLAIVASMKDSIERGAQHFVKFMASASVSLGLFNLLPIPSLDGIKMLWLTLEGITRRNLKPKWQELINVAGLLGLLLLMGVLTVKDSVRLFGSKDEASTPTPTAPSTPTETSPPAPSTPTEPPPPAPSTPTETPPAPTPTEALPPG